MLSQISFEHARSLVFDGVPKPTKQKLGLDSLHARVLAEDVHALVDLPGYHVSLKDGYAVCSDDLRSATPDSMVELKLVGKITAGAANTLVVRPGQAARITTGAVIPEGADAVLAEEFCHRAQHGSDRIMCFADARPGRNILPPGSDIKKGEKILKAGTRLMPPDIGLMAAAGWDEAEVFRVPRVLVLSTGDEVVAPGGNLGKGKLFASNLVEISSWLGYLGSETVTKVVADDKAIIKKAIADSLESSDSVITTGGAWTSERDLIIGILDGLGWKPRFHRVRMGPGKGVGFGLLEGRPVFCLPGGPPSNEMALLQLALPGLARMQGIFEPLFPSVRCVLLEPVSGQVDWTQFVPAKFEQVPEEDPLYHQHLVGVRPYRIRSRLQSMAHKQALIRIPEGVEQLRAGQIIEVQGVRYGNKFIPGD